MKFLTNRLFKYYSKRFKQKGFTEEKLRRIMI